MKNDSKKNWVNERFCDDRDRCPKIAIIAILVLSFTLFVLWMLWNPSLLSTKNVKFVQKTPFSQIEVKEKTSSEGSDVANKVGSKLEAVKEKAGKTLDKLKEDVKSKIEELPKPNTADSENVAEYNRNEYGGWADLDGDGCNTRDEILARDLQNVQIGSDGCTVLAGDLIDPYTGNKVRFIKSARNVEVDHIVPVKLAHVNGLHKESKLGKKLFYNDHDNLLAVSKEANRAKSDKGLKEWVTELPPEFQESFKIKYCSISAKYSLLLEGC